MSNRKEEEKNAYDLSKKNSAREHHGAKPICRMSRCMFGGAIVKRGSDIVDNKKTLAEKHTMASPPFGWARSA